MTRIYNDENYKMTIGLLEEVEQVMLQFTEW